MAEAPAEIPVRNRLRLPDVGDWPSFNPSIHKDQVLVRTSSYILHDDGRITLKGVLETKNYLFKFKPEGWEVEPFEAPEHTLWKNGLEDGRLFSWKGRDWVLFSACFQMPKGKKWIVSRNTMILMDLETKQFVPLHTDQMREKNWMPIPSEELSFLYSVSPWVILNSSGEIQSQSVGPGTAWSGSSQFIPFDGKWLGVVHRRVKKGSYVHAFVLMNEDLSFNRLSKPFVFHKDQIEFCAGLDRQGDDFVLSYGVMDREAWICRVSKETVLEYLRVPAGATVENPPAS